MAKRRSGRGTFVRFTSTRTGYLLTFRRENGQEITAPLDIPVAQKLARDYGVLDKHVNGKRSMAPLKDASIRYRETSQGLLVEVEVLPN